MAAGTMDGTKGGQGDDCVLLGIARFLVPGLLWLLAHEYPATMSSYAFTLSHRLPSLHAY